MNRKGTRNQSDITTNDTATDVVEISSDEADIGTPHNAQMVQRGITVSSQRSYGQTPSRGKRGIDSNIANEDNAQVVRRSIIQAGPSCSSENEGASTQKGQKNIASSLQRASAQTPQRVNSPDPETTSSETCQRVIPFDPLTTSSRRAQRVIPFHLQSFNETKRGGIAQSTQNWRSRLQSVQDNPQNVPRTSSQVAERGYSTTGQRSSSQTAKAGERDGSQMAKSDRSDTSKRSHTHTFIGCSHTTETSFTPTPQRDPSVPKENWIVPGNNLCFACGRNTPHAPESHSETAQRGFSDSSRRHSIQTVLDVMQEDSEGYQGNRPMNWFGDPGSIESIYDVVNGYAVAQLYEQGNFEAFQWFTPFDELMDFVLGPEDAPFLDGAEAERNPSAETPQRVGLRGCGQRSNRLPAFKSEGDPVKASKEPSPFDPVDESNVRPLGPTITLDDITSLDGVLERCVVNQAGLSQSSISSSPPEQQMPPVSAPAYPEPSCPLEEDRSLPQ